MQNSCMQTLPHRRSRIQMQPEPKYSQVNYLLVEVKTATVVFQWFGTPPLLGSKPQNKSCSCQRLSCLTQLAAILVSCKKYKCKYKYKYTYKYKKISCLTQLAAILVSCEKYKYKYKHEYKYKYKYKRLSCLTQLAAILVSCKKYKYKYKLRYKYKYK